jgi:hypothetical protein
MVVPTPLGLNVDVLEAHSMYLLFALPRATCCKAQSSRLANRVTSGGSQLTHLRAHCAAMFAHQSGCEHNFVDQRNARCFEEGSKGF